MIQAAGIGDAAMNDTFTPPTLEELNECLRHGREARSEATAAMLRRMWEKLTERVEAPSEGKYA
jgi:hypothetical protein